MSGRNVLLFSQDDLSSVLQHQEQQLFKEIDRTEGNQLLNTSLEDLLDYFQKKYTVEPLRLKEDGITVDQHEVDIDVSQDFHRAIFDRSKPFYVKGTEVLFFIPYDGDQRLFKCRPSQFTLSPPRGSVNDESLIISFKVVEHNSDQIRSEFDRTLDWVRRYVEWIERDVSAFNASLRDKARKRLEGRREKLLKDHGLAASLGFPLRKRSDASDTYVVPTVRRKITPRMPEASTAPFIPEPTLEMGEYDHILSVISNMAKVIERSPRAFKQMAEEDLRQHFLVQLNGQYEGQATGETFNFEGKTDILIRVENRNIFVAECKFWRGAQSFKDAIDQLLNYACWRDTKTALVVFNRGKNLSHVLQQIPEIVKAHPNYKRQVDCPFETGFRFVLHHRDDPNRELFLTVMVFEVPA